MLFRQRFLLTSFLLCIVYSGRSQEFTEKLKESFFERTDSDKELFFEFLKNEEEINYLTFADSYEPEFPEGFPALNAREGYNVIIEGNVAPNFYIVKPFNSTTGKHRNWALTFQGLFNLRLINAKSSPSLPPSNSFGFKADILEHNGKISNGYITVELNHYSNGGSPGAFDQQVLEDFGRTRNKYIGGDFSTNYYRLGRTQIFNTHFFKQLNYVALYAYFQRDLSLFGPLNYLGAQNDRYGNSRIGGKFTFSTTLGSNQGVHLMIRYKPEVIIDKAEILDQGETTHRMANKVQITGSMPSLGDMGLFTQFYWGRDYMNIRYDIPIFYWSFGVSFNVAPDFTNLEKVGK